METETIPNKRFQLYDMDVERHQYAFARDVAFGLTAPQKWLPPKYFYDERGSRLYEQICGLREYYPYRAELEILSTYA
ncbi:MAG TPA: L-histidine N(alpha)-methyltransferase, partial [Candidatus Binataceae bacterium]|nr:L-histidine N(alpha)-methyltransferase [Candidatus Binataceae bacterium]